MPSEAIPFTNKDDLIYQSRSGSDDGPLLIMLHGLGGDEQSMSLFTRSIPAAFTVISPRAPIAIQPGMFPGYTDRGYSWVRSAPPPDRVSFAPAIDRLRQFIRSFDRAPVFLMGFSQGAALSYALSLVEPELIAGVIALAGFLPDEAMHPERSGGRSSTPQRFAQNAPAAQSKDALPRHGYLIIHSVDDQTVPLHRAHQARDFLQALGAPVEYHAYPGGHKIAAQGLKDITRWLEAR
ncbi:MAG: alpha/beta fold hydrolase [Chloroflexi bacterium]|nr:alpha/beta fold hydrolase [Chloroflexota bacterium]